MWRSWWRFLEEWWRDFHHTGAVAPSSRYLARAMTAVLRQPRPAWRIVEVGPGTGAVTAWILPALKEGDRLDLVEINPRFVEFLQVRFASQPLFRRYSAQAYLHPMAIQDFLPEQPVDCVISGLPFNNFPADTVREILEHVENWLRPGGWLVYFEYWCIRQLKMPFVGKRERLRLYRVGRILEKFRKRHTVRRQLVLCNLPPAVVHTVQLCPVTVPQPQRPAELSSSPIAPSD